MSHEYWRVNAPDVISETIDGETIILHLGNGFYFSAGGCGPLLWEMLSTSVPVADVVDAVAAGFDCAGVDVRGEVERFIGELTAEGLLVPAEAAGGAARAVDGGGAFEPATLSKFTDMEDLLLLDPVHEVSPQQGWPHAAPQTAAE